ncbi:MAG: hypothetical protein IPI30_06215 [Saprospiraceae bacterium]|nr:hypothetical protein [Candidatus Vicinibacter affinis]
MDARTGRMTGFAVNTIAQYLVAYCVKGISGWSIDLSASKRIPDKCAQVQVRAGRRI